jgi:hypothetical protein
MVFRIVQGSVIVMNFGESGMSAVVCVAVSDTMAEKIVEALNLQMATDLLNGV